MRGRRDDDDGDGDDDGGVCADGDDDGGNGDGGDDEHRGDGGDGARAQGRTCASPAFLEPRAGFYGTAKFLRAILPQPPLRFTKATFPL